MPAASPRLVPAKTANEVRVSSELHSSLRELVTLSPKVHSSRVCLGVVLSVCPTLPPGFVLVGLGWLMHPSSDPELNKRNYNAWNFATVTGAVL